MIPVYIYLLVFALPIVIWVIAKAVAERKDV